MFGIDLFLLFTRGRVVYVVDARNLVPWRMDLVYQIPFRIDLKQKKQFRMFEVFRHGIYVNAEMRGECVGGGGVAIGSQLGVQLQYMQLILGFNGFYDVGWFEADWR